MISPTHEELNRWRPWFAAEAAELPASVQVSDAERERYAQWYEELDGAWFNADPPVDFPTPETLRFTDARAPQIGRPYTPSSLLFLSVLNPGLPPPGRTESYVEVRLGRNTDELVTTLQLQPTLRAPKSVRFTGGEAFHRTGEVHLIVTPGARGFEFELSIVRSF